MGKLPIIPPSDITRDNAKEGSQEERRGEDRATATTTTVATAAAVIDGAEARSADRDHRFLIASREKYARGRSAIGRSDLAARRKRRDAPPHANTWHAESRSEAARVTDRDPGGSPRIGVIGDHVARACALDVADPAGLWSARIAGDDRRTCCVSGDAFLARRRRTRERADLVARRNRQADSASLIRRPAAAGYSEEILRGAVDSITQNQHRFLEIPEGRILSSNVSGSPTIVRDVDTQDPRTDPARLIEISIVESSCKKRPCVLAEETVNRRSTSRFPAKIDPGGYAWRTGTRWKSLNIGLVQRTLLLGLLATSLLCDAVLAAPPSSLVLENDVEEELAMPRNGLGDDELEIIRRSIVQGLGLQRIPDPSKVSRQDLARMARYRNCNLRHFRFLNFVSCIN